ncbi:hypothetical protein [Halalkalicoccus subterraneus]|nr:hypothetical protein [Halalkalicoccus subterraneus]
MLSDTVDGWADSLEAAIDVRPPVALDELFVERTQETGADPESVF